MPNFIAAVVQLCCDVDTQEVTVLLDGVRQKMPQLEALSECLLPLTEAEAYGHPLPMCSSQSAASRLFTPGNKKQWQISNN